MKTDSEKRTEKENPNPEKRMNPEEGKSKTPRVVYEIKNVKLTMVPQPKHPTDEYRNCIEQLTAWCKAVHGRQSALARALDISHSQVSLWLSFEREIGLNEWTATKAIMRRNKGNSILQ